MIGNTIRVLPNTTSTNDEASRAALEGHPEGLVIFAESQSAGRGRMGRRWSSPAGRGLWFSVLLRPSLAPGECTQLTAAHGQCAGAGHPISHRHHAGNQVAQ